MTHQEDGSPSCKKIGNKSQITFRQHKFYANSASVVFYKDNPDPNSKTNIICCHPVNQKEFAFWFNVITCKSQEHGSPYSWYNHIYRNLQYENEEGIAELFDDSCMNYKWINGTLFMWYINNWE